MEYFYYQQTGGDEKWRAIPQDKLETVKGAMFVTVLSLDSPVTESATKEQLADIKYKGPLYFDFDSEDAWDTAKSTLALVDKLLDTYELREQDMALYVSGGKGFHLTIPQAVFMAKPAPLQFLPHIYKEIAFELAEEHMDFRVYTARRGRMFRQANVQRPNGLYKVRISLAELRTLTKLDAAAAKERYKELASTPRPDEPITNAQLATELLALFDASKSKVSKNQKKAAKRKPVKLPEKLPSFDKLLNGEGIAEGVGFHQISLQVAIVAHQRGMSKDDLIAAANGLCEKHHSDSNRYNSPAKRREELARMWDYTEDNPCYEYSGYAIAALLTHKAPDLHGLEIDEDEIDVDVAGDGDEYNHAGVTLTRRGVFMKSEDGNQRQVSAIGFDNVAELVSVDKSHVSVLEADVKVAGIHRGRATMELDTFNSVSKLNGLAMKFGQAFTGTDVQGRGLYLRLVEKARKGNNRMYCVGREGLDVISIPFHEDEELRKPFMIWADSEGVTPEPRVAAKQMNFKFVGYPTERGQFECDLSQAPSLPQWLKEDGNREVFKKTLTALMSCQKPWYIGKLVGWMIACHYRMLFHKLHGKFPLLHINGAAGSGKTETTKVVAYFHYLEREPKMLTPSSTFFPVQFAASGSCSIPLIIDEFKPQDIGAMHDKYKLLFRDAYNCREMQRGGGTRENSDYRAIHSINLAAPICFIAEAAESESAVMERVVMLTMVKPPIVEASAFLRNLTYVNENKHVLSIIGHYLSASLVKSYSIEKLKEEFNIVYDEARLELMLQPGEADTLSPEEYKRKANAKERTVYNYAVAKFGLMKLKNLALNALGDAPELAELFNDALAVAYDSANTVQAHTQAEWLKVLNDFSAMSRADPDAPYSLKENVDYAIVHEDGRDCFEIYTQQCYYKYRMFSKAVGMKPLFPSLSAFIHAMNNLPATVAVGGTGAVQELQNGCHILSLDELRAAGFIDPVAK